MRFVAVSAFAGVLLDTVDPLASLFDQISPEEWKRRASGSFALGCIMDHNGICVFEADDCLHKSRQMLRSDIKGFESFSSHPAWIYAILNNGSRVVPVHLKGVFELVVRLVWSGIVAAKLAAWQQR